MKWLFVLGLIVVATAGLWLVPQDRNDREKREGGGVIAGSTASTPHHDIERSPGAVGTSGTHDGAAETNGGDVITEVETITGTNDGMRLVGRRVDLHVDVQERANDHAFWVGSRDNRLLVVLRRDRRDGMQRQQGRPSNHGISPVHGGQRAAISGVIRAVPEAEQRYSWSLTRDDEQELADRKIYIDADTVSSEGHGTH
jgi:hypothetical protein